MNVDELLKKNNDFFIKEKNENLYKYINLLVDEFDIVQNKLNQLLLEVEDTIIDDNVFYLNLKKENFKKIGFDLENKLYEIEKKWGDLILILNQRFK